MWSWHVTFLSFLISSCAAHSKFQNSCWPTAMRINNASASVGGNSPRRPLRQCPTQQFAPSHLQHDTVIQSKGGTLAGIPSTGPWHWWGSKSEHGPPLSGPKDTTHASSGWHSHVGTSKSRWCLQAQTWLCSGGMVQVLRPGYPCSCWYWSVLDFYLEATLTFQHEVIPPQEQQSHYHCQSLIK